MGIPIINATNFKLNNQKLENEILSHIDINELVERYGVKSNAIVGKAYS
ncbi:MAG: hypothetical protein KDD94_02840 [Calditrichaeota bacterium]|nr:hypothetical protein [Calditrichota bacterium]